MSEIQEQEVRRYLLILFSKIKDTIEHLLTNGNLVPIQEPYFHMKVTNFEYSEKGVTNFGSLGNTITKNPGTWLLMKF